MYKGFYDLTSSMLTQERRLNIISNNMSNTATPGFKKDLLMTTTFEEKLVTRTGSVDKSNSTTFTAETSMIQVADEKVTDYEQGGFDDTGRPLDAAIVGPGFFEIQTSAGDRVYTRNGSFTLDEEGYMFLQHIGRVMGNDGQPVMLGTDKISISDQGSVMNRETGEVLGQLGVVDFTDYTLLEKTGEGMFTDTGGAGAEQIEQPRIKGGTLERSNVIAMDEMVAMMTSQRALQSSSAVLKMYDMLMQKAANDIGRI